MHGTMHGTMQTIIRQAGHHARNHGIITACAAALRHVQQQD